MHIDNTEGEPVGSLIDSLGVRHTPDPGEIVTDAAFYCGWPKAWAVFRMAKEIWND